MTDSNDANVDAAASSNDRIDYRMPGFVPDNTLESKSLSDFAVGIGFEDVFLSEDDVNPVTTARNAVKTRLYHIKGVLTMNIQAKDLRSVCSVLGVPGLRNANSNKASMAAAIVSKKVSHDTFGQMIERGLSHA